VRMRLAAFAQSRMTLRFDYFKQERGAQRLVAHGEQEIACMRRDEAGHLVPTSWPATLAAALRA
jgi:enediyne core biosynthesis thioesterase